VLIIPKVIGGVGMIPESIGGKPVVLAYSVPTKYAGTSVPIWEFGNRPVHLLGGSPHRQMEIYRYLPNVISADGNYAQRMAMVCGFWVPGTSLGARNRWWPTLREAGCECEHDAPYEAFRKSCENIMTAWSAL